ncbi:MAG: hypothetical protein IT249_18545 [Chitinophagaceae bacterium]|nr:hypothetical protein [Chitinophagaceae bacterium]
MRYILFTAIIVLGSLYFSFAQDSTLKYRTQNTWAKALADSSKFRPNIQSDWSMFNSYMATAADSVLFEVTISHSRDIDWNQFQRFGKIVDKRFWPSLEQNIDYYLLDDRYIIKIDETGSCFVKLSGGQLPPRDPVVLPIKISYKRK